ncbi:N-acetyl-alpha-D-glucosaminyl L-malate synthase [bioreactor metagenome]|uniref:N-acetyl-alpha-D-glucosaminyl L-malate synthase n=1 Tax=bioreactor metagenome TaxID=1076179 RepID=A0A645JJV5_9ZZZZ
MREAIDVQLRQADIADRFHFAGLIPPDQVPRYLALADQLWHLSLHEGLPRSVVQALASGKPAIGFRLDGTPEIIIHGETGYCVTPEDTHMVVEYARQLLEDPVKSVRMGMTGRERTAVQFDWRRMGDILEAEYVANLTKK